MKSDLRQAADPAAVNCCCLSRREPWQSAVRRRKEPFHLPVTIALVRVARPQMTLWGWGLRMPVSLTEKEAVQGGMGRRWHFADILSSTGYRFWPDAKHLCRKKSLRTLWT